MLFLFVRRGTGHTTYYIKYIYTVFSVYIKVTNETHFIITYIGVSPQF